MPLFRELTDEEQIAKWDKEEKQMLRRNFNLLSDQTDYPQKAYLLSPKKILATSYYSDDDGNVIIDIGYKNSISAYVANHVRMNYNRTIRGTLICKGVVDLKENDFPLESNIKKSLFSKYKTITFPIYNVSSVKLKCKEICIKDIDIFVEYGDKEITEQEFLRLMKQHYDKE